MLMKYTNKNETLSTFPFTTNENRINLSNGLWETHKMDEKCLIIEQWNISTLQLWWNKDKQMIRKVKEISFPRLIIMTLGRNNIESIEGLNRVWMPVLEDIYMTQNNIVSVQDLRKVYWKSINYISLENNKINEGNIFPCIPGKLLERINLELLAPVFQINYVHWVIKLETIKFKRFSFTSFKRIKEKEMQERIKKKYENIKLDVKY